MLLMESSDQSQIIANCISNEVQDSMDVSDEKKIGRHKSVETEIMTKYWW